MAKRERKVPLRRSREAAPSRRIFILVLIAIAQAIFFMSSIFRLQLVDVKGTVRLSEDAVIKAAALPDGVHLAQLDPKAIARRVGRLRWVREASVRRRLPGQVIIRVRERLPRLAASAADAEFPTGWFVVADDGTVLAPARGREDDRLPRVTVPGSLRVDGRLDPHLVAAVLDFYANLPESLSGRLTAMRSDENGQLEMMLRLRNRLVRVRMGGSDRTRYKFQVLQALIERLTREKAAVAYIDLRYSDPAVGRITKATKVKAPAVP